MAHTRPEQLADLRAELAAIAALPAMLQKSPGIFYCKRTPFLHFHDKDGERWADLKVNSVWERVPIDFAASAAQRRTFLARVKAVHRSYTGERQ